MFVNKKKYYLFIENTRAFNLNLIKKRNKFHIIYRNHNNDEKLNNLIKFRNNCKKRGVKFYIANDISLLSKIKPDGLYISAYNKNLSIKFLSAVGYKIIGSAHNQKEINIRIIQGCKEIIFSRLFKTNYKFKKGFLGINKFNILSIRTKQKLIPLGGIDEFNLKKLNIVRCESFACLSIIKKKPANIINRLF